MVGGSGGTARGRTAAPPSPIESPGFFSRRGSGPYTRIDRECASRTRRRRGDRNPRRIMSSKKQGPCQEVKVRDTAHGQAHRAAVRQNVNRNSAHQSEFARIVGTRTIRHGLCRTAPTRRPPGKPSTISMAPCRNGSSRSIRSSGTVMDHDHASRIGEDSRYQPQFDDITSPIGPVCAPQHLGGQQLRCSRQWQTDRHRPQARPNEATLAVPLESGGLAMLESSRRVEGSPLRSDGPSHESIWEPRHRRRNS